MTLLSRHDNAGLGHHCEERGGETILPAGKAGLILRRLAMTGGLRLEPPGTRRRQAGFTLIELLVVLVILGLLGGLVGPQVLSYLGGSRIKTAKLQIEQLSAALDLYRLDNRVYPTSEQGLRALIVAPTGVNTWHGPYLAKGEVPLDPWGHPYHYIQPGQHGSYDLYSDGSEGEAKSVTNW